jgi:hypothetical protein
VLVRYRGNVDQQPGISPAQLHPRGIEQADQEITENLVGRKRPQPPRTVMGVIRRPLLFLRGATRPSSAHGSTPPTSASGSAACYSNHPIPHRLPGDVYPVDAGYRIAHGRRAVPAREYRKDRHPAAGHRRCQITEGSYVPYPRCSVPTRSGWEPFWRCLRWRADIPVLNSGHLSCHVCTLGASVLAAQSGGSVTMAARAMPLRGVPDWEAGAGRSVAAIASPGEIRVLLSASG